MTQEAYSKGIAEWMVAQRAELGISQAELAAAIGVSQSAIVTWERGTSSISSYSHAKLRAFFKQQKDLRVTSGRTEVVQG